MNSQLNQRQLLMAENVGWWSDAWVGNLFQEAPWKDPPLISYSAEPYRNASRHPTRHVQSWAPAGLIPIKMLIANDGESVLHALAELKRCEAGALALESVLHDLAEQKQRDAERFHLESVLDYMAEQEQQETDEFRFFRSDEVDIRGSFSQDLPDLLELPRDAPLLFVRRIYYNRCHHPLLTQELRSPADQQLFAGRLLQSDPDPFEIAGARVRELVADWSKPV